MSGILPAARTRRNAPDPAVPLINLVFLLLAFFLIAGNLARKDPVPIELPQTPPVEGGGQVYEAQLYIGPEGEFYDIAGNPHAEAGAALAAAQGSRRKDLAIRADRRAPASALLEAAEQASASGFASVRILTLNEAGALPQAQNK